MNGFIVNIEKLTNDNNDFRHVLYTSKHLQLVLMAIPAGEEIGEETHKDRDQFFRIEKGEGEIIINDKHSTVQANDAMIVPAGAKHNIVNIGKDPLQIYTIYGPPEHRDGIIRHTKAEAMSTKEHFDGKTTEGSS